METPEAAPRAPAPGTVPLPIGDVLRIANEYERGGRLDDAKRLLDCILATAPNQGDALHLSGIVAFRQGEIATALDLMERSIRHGIDTPLYLRNICEVYRAMGRLDEAIIHYHRLELNECLDCANPRAAYRPQPAGGAFRARRGAAAAR
jgi:tetratricopeptide (TPR) repeat protein